MTPLVDAAEAALLAPPPDPLMTLMVAVPEARGVQEEDAEGVEEAEEGREDIVSRDTGKR